MPLIKLTPEVLMEKASGLRATAERNNDVIARLNTLVDGLEADWEGDAYNAFRESYLTKRSTFEKFTIDMDVFAKYLEDFATIMRDQEKLQADKARQLAGR